MTHSGNPTGRQANRAKARKAQLGFPDWHGKRETEVCDRKARHGESQSSDQARETARGTNASVWCFIPFVVNQVSSISRKPIVVIGQFV